MTLIKILVTLVKAYTGCLKIMTTKINTVFITLKFKLLFDKPFFFFF